MKGLTISRRLAAFIIVASLLQAEGHARCTWVARYAGTNDADDFPQDIAVDDHGNAYVTGRSEEIVTPDRTVRHRRYQTVKFGARGRLLWDRRHRGGPTGHNHALRILRDSAGHLYVTGGSGTNTAAPQIATLKYDSDGNLMWVSRFGIEGETWPADTAVDTAGNLYVAGLGNGFIGGPDQGLMFLTYKIDVNGQVMWSQKYRPTRQEFPYAIAVSALGEACVTGTYPSAAGGEIATVKYTANGAEAWAHSFGATNELSEQGRAVAFDQHGNVYVTGGGTLGFLTLKYASEGTLLWSALYPKPAGRPASYATRIAMDPDGNIVVAGTAHHETQRANWAVVKYSPEGTELWVRQFNHPNNFDDELAGMVVGNDGSIYVAGSMETNHLGLSFLVTAKYSKDGDEIWRTEYASSSPPRDRAVDLAIDSNGVVYVLAESRRAANGDPDYLVLKYEQAGSAPRFIESTPFSGGGLTLRIFAQAGTTCSVEVSENLRAWTNLTNCVNQTGIIEVIDTPGTSGQRFYRLHSPAQ